MFTMEHKPVVDHRPLVWLKGSGVLDPVLAGTGAVQEFKAPGTESILVNLHEDAQQPFNASLCTKRRQQAEAAAAGEAAAAHNKKAKSVRFTPLDFTAMVLDKNLRTPNAVLAYVQDQGSEAAQLYCARNQKRLPELLSSAEQWREAKQQRALEVESDWALVQRLAAQPCSCGSGNNCKWHAAAVDFFHRNRATVDADLLAATLAQIISHGPSKTARVPLIAGVTSAGKSMLLDPVIHVFGPQAVDYCPAQGATMALSSLATNQRLRFIYWDEFSPTEFASRPPRAPTVMAVTFKKLFAGQYFRLQVSQSHHDGNPDFRWTRGAAMTAPLRGLREAVEPVTMEDVRHMQSRVIQFEAHEPIQSPLQAVPHCAETWCRYVVEGAAAYAARRPPQVQERPIDEDDL